MRTIIRAFGLLAAVGPIAGVPARGFVHCASASGELIIPKRTVGFPILTSLGGKPMVDPSLAVRVSAAMTVDEVGGPVPIESVWGSPAFNLPEGTPIRWLNPPAGLAAPTSLVVDGPLAGAVAGAVGRLVLYEGIGSASAARDLWLATGSPSSGKPGVVLAWESSDGYTPTGNAKQTHADVWSFAVAVGRNDNASARGFEGVDLLDRLESRFTMRGHEPLGVISSTPIQIRARNRLRVSDDLYVYTLSFATTGTVELDDEGGNAPSWNPWDSTAFEYPTQASETLPTPSAPPLVVAKLKVTMPGE